MPALPDSSATDPLHSPEFQAGLLALQQNDREAAIAAFTWAAGRFPMYGPVHANIGTLAGQLGHSALAMRCFQRAIAVDPGHAEVWSNFSSQLRRTDREDAAVMALKRALSLEPKHANALCNLGAILFDAGQTARAEACFRQALALAPNHHEAAKNLGFALLRRGDLRIGFSWYEHRYAAAPLPAPVFDPPVPRWRGGTLKGLSLLAVAEQGEGDTIQFVRYAKLVERGGGTLTITCSHALKRLMARADGVRHMVATGDPMPRVDAWAPLLSLPHLLGTDHGSIPGGVPYLHPAPEDAAAWRTQLSGVAGLKVGLVWAGNPAFGGDRHRSPRFAAVAPLLALPGLHMVLLQVGDGRRDLAGHALPRPSPIWAAGSATSRTRRRSWPDSTSSSPPARRRRILQAPWAGRSGSCCHSPPTGAGWRGGPTAPGIRPQGCSASRRPGTGPASSRRSPPNCRRWSPVAASWRDWHDRNSRRS
ncbi:tetratricopeptide repeat protein [Azospirillum sp. TSH100]|uniref:tetratricopeptide repeat protein n=1 Tax=Azospirillum sp. TSH100 TaxID=652764 RepID=UPI00145ACEBB|nr:tetratricopeptide repeat protein [Azospirillum sp. TSH100]